MIAAGYVPYGYRNPAPGDGRHLLFIPHSLPIVAAGLFLALLAILLWAEHVRVTHRCTCQGKEPHE